MGTQASIAWFMLGFVALLFLIVMFLNLLITRKATAADKARKRE